MTRVRRRTVVVLALLCGLSTVSAKATDAPIDLNQGLIAYWPLDDGVAEAVSGLEFTSTRAQSEFVDGIAGKSLQSREGAANGGVSLQASDSTSLKNLKEFTLSTWYRIDAMGGRGEKAAFRHTGGALGWYNPDDRSRYYFTTAYRERGSGERRFSSLPTQLGTQLGVWHHVVQRVDARGKHEVWHAAMNSPGHIYGARAGQELSGFDSIALAEELAQRPFVLGFYEKKGQPSGGSISTDEIALWDRALSTEEIQRLFLLGSGGHQVTAEVSAEELGIDGRGGKLLPPLSDFGWTSRWIMVQEKKRDSATLQSDIKTTGEMAIVAKDVIVLERQFPGVSSGKLKVEYRVRPRYVTVEVHAPGASGMKTYLRNSQQEGSWTMRWHYPWAWPAIGGNTVPRFYVIDGRGGKRKGLEYTDLLMESGKWYTVATVLDLDKKTWEFWVNGQRFDSQVNLGRATMRWWKTDATTVDTLRFMSHGTNWIDSFRVYHNDQLIAKTDFTTEEGYVDGQSIFASPHADE